MDAQEPSTVKVEVAPAPVAVATTTAPTAPSTVAAASPKDTLSNSKKRKYEEATYDEKRELVRYAAENPHLKQRELAEWFHETFDKAINQSTVSRNLKRFKNETPETAAEQTPTVRRRPAKAKQSSTPPRRLTPQETRYVPYIPKGTQERPQEVEDHLLYVFYLSYRRRNVGASSAEIITALKAEAQRIGVKGCGQDISDAWIENWQRSHSVLPPSPSSSSSGSSSPPASDIHPQRERTPSVSNSTGNASANSSLTFISVQSRMEQPPTPLVRSPARDGSPASGNLTEERQRKREIRRLRKDVEKREKQILKARGRKELSLQRLAELEKGLGSHSLEERSDTGVDNGQPKAQE